MDRARAARLLRRPHAEAQFIVQFRDAAPGPDDVARYARGGVRGLQRIGEGEFHLLETEGGGDDVLASLSEHPEIAYIEPNYLITLEKTPNDPMFGQQYGLKNAVPAGADIAATAAWDYTTGGRKTVVAVIDTGVDFNHPDLTANIWKAPRAYTFTGAAGTVTCPAGSTGVNAITSTCVPMDDNGHGTHCAGIVGASGDNGAGVTGVNWTASIMPVKFLTNSGSGVLSDALRAIDAVVQIKKQLGVDANIRVISASWGFMGNSQALDASIAAANAADILFVAAAGNNSANNDDRASFPANSTQPNVISVAATDKFDALASFSNYGSKVHLAAPGVSIASTYLDGKYVGMSGTSMATPMVAGAAALLLSTCSANTAALRDHILTTVDAIPGLAGKTATGGRLNVYKAVRRCAAPAATLTAAVVSQTVKAGATAPYSLLPGGVGGLSGAGTLVITGLPAGVTVPAAIPVTLGTAATVTVTAAATAAAGTYPLTATLTAGGNKATLPLTLVVLATPKFSVTFSAPPAAVKTGSSTAVTVKVNRVTGFTSPVTVTPTGLPLGVLASPITVAAGQTTGTLTLVVGHSAAAGPLTFALTATGGTPVTTVTLSTPITVAKVPTLALGFKTAQLSVKAGTTAMLECIITSNVAFTAFQLSMSGLPGATSVQVSPSSPTTFRLLISTPTAWSGKTAELKVNVTAAGMAASATANVVFTP